MQKLLELQKHWRFNKKTHWNISEVLQQQKHMIRVSQTGDEHRLSDCRWRETVVNTVILSPSAFFSSREEVWGSVK